MQRSSWVLWVIILILSAGCSGDAVVFAPTPLPPDTSPTIYQHPSGAFEIALPKNWSVYEQRLTTLASASFAPPEQDTPRVQIAVINLGREITADELGQLMTRYQAEIRPDVQQYTEQNRQAMGDGSWRLTGVRTDAAGAPQPVNTFIDREGSLLGIINVIVPTEAALQTNIQTIINTFQLTPQNADLPVGELTTLSSAAAVPLQITNVATWTTSEGVFFITGEIANYSETPVSDVPVRASLLTADGAEVAGAVDTVMGYTIEPNGFAPFSLRFGQGQPVDAVEYTVELGREGWQPTPPDNNERIVGTDALRWSDDTEYANGNLFITGTVTNISPNPVRQPRAVATIFDDRGRVIAAGFADVDTDVLNAQGEAPFSILIPERGGNAANYIVTVQARACDSNC